LTNLSQGTNHYRIPPCNATAESRLVYQANNQQNNTTCPLTTLSPNHYYWSYSYPHGSCSYAYASYVHVHGYSPHDCFPDTIRRVPQTRNRRGASCHGAKSRGPSRETCASCASSCRLSCTAVSESCKGWRGGDGDVLVAQHVCADGAGDETAEGAECAAAELVTQEGAAGTADEGRTESAVAFCGPAGLAGLAVLGRTVSDLLVLIAVGWLLSVAVLLLVGILVTLVLLRGRVGRVAAVGIVALVVLALGRSAVALLVLLVRVVGRCLVRALRRVRG
jgi:hypothetical protein